MATREWFAKGDDGSGGDIPENVIGVPITLNGELKHLRAGTNLSVRVGGKFLDAKDTTYSQATITELRNGSNVSNKLINPSNVKTVIEESVLPSREIINTNRTINADLNGKTCIITANVNMSILLPNSYVEYYLVNHTSSKRMLTPASGVSFHVDGVASQNSCYIEPWGAVVVIWFNSTTAIIKGDVTN